MDILKFRDSLASLWVNQILADLVDTERKYLVSLFDLKEIIDQRLEFLNSTWLNLKENELFQDLSMASNLLFTEFYKKYCGNKFPMNVLKEGVVSQVMEDTNWKFDESLFNDFPAIDEYIRLNLSRSIFDNVDKKDILFILNDGIWNNDIIFDILEVLIENYFDEKKNLIKEFFGDSEKNFSLKKVLNLSNNNWDSPDFIDPLLDIFANSYVDFVFNAVKSALKDNPQANFDDLVRILDVFFLIFFDKKKLVDWFFEFCSKVSLEDKNDLSFSNVDSVEPHDSDWLFFNVESIFNKFWCWLDLEFSDLDIKSIEWKAHKSLFNFFDKNFKELNLREFSKSWEGLRSHADEKKLKFAEQAFQKYRKVIFPYWKNYCFSEFDKLLFNQKIFQISEEDEKAFLDEMFQKYPKAKKYAWSLWAQKKSQLKWEFIKTQNVLSENLVNSIVWDNNEFFSKLNLQDLFLFVQFSKLLFSGESFSLSDKYKKYYFDFVESKIRESHLKVVEKENWKKREDMPEELTLKKVKEKQDAPQKTYVPEKKQLPKWMFPQIVDYLNWRLNKKDLDDLERSLRNCWWKYKMKWFKKYWLDSWFFTILDQYWFERDDEIIAETTEDSGNDSLLSTWLSTITDDNTSDTIDSPEISQLKEIIQKINETEDINQKVDYYVEAFWLFYDFKDVGYIKTQILNFIKSDVRILKWIVSVLEKFIKWQREEIKTSKSVRKRYFTFDIWYNTWYRIVLQDQDWSTKKKIVDFVDHDTYEDRIPSYYCRY